MTNLIAAISISIVTNWTVTSVEYPKRPEPDEHGATIAIYIATGYHETGTVLSNTVANIKWNGKDVPVVLDSVQLRTEQRVRWR